MPLPAIPFNHPALLEQSLAYAREAFGNGHLSGNGPFTRQCQGFIESYLAANKALLTTSCSDALELCALLLDLKAGDEVIVPSFTFVTSASAFALRGARPVFVDVRPDTFNLDETLLEAAFTARTRAVVAVHYAGVGCEMDAICPLSARHGVTLIEDNAHGLLGGYKGKPLGSFSELATLSFHETKNLNCGEGGAVVVNNPRYRERAEIIWEKGTDRSRFFRGEVAKYTWVELGSSFVLSDVLAALLWAQIQAREQIQQKRREIHHRYAAGLADWAHQSGVMLPRIPSHCDSSFHLFSLLMPTPRGQGGLISHLRSFGIHAVFHYQPLHLTPMGRQLGGRPGQCPVAESVADRLVRLPFFIDLSLGDQERVIDAVRSFHP